MGFYYGDYDNYAKELSERYQILNGRTANKEETFINSKGFLEGKELAKNVSFTPYIFNGCSADCKFCSEKLERKNGKKNDFALCEEYFEKLSEILNMLQDNEIFLSISGMEPLESIEFLNKVLKEFQKFEKNGGKICEKVVYSNLSAGTDNLEEIIQLIKTHNIARIETSRHHYNDAKNNNIMRFKNKRIIFNKTYEKIIRDLQKEVLIKLVCVLQNTGINNYPEVKKYLGWASGIGIKNVVFRELSIFDESIIKNENSDYIKDNRVPLINILKMINEDEFKLKEIHKGYYYFSFKYLYKEDTEVTFEVSDYEEMIRHHNGDKIKKLIYYPNGNLCCDWNMENKIY